MSQLELDLAELGVISFCRVARHHKAHMTEAASLVPSEAMSEENPNLQVLLDSIVDFRQLLLTSPDLAVLEGLSRRNYVGSVLVFTPQHLPSERVATLRENVPPSLDVELLGCTEAPRGLSPFGATFVTIGFQAGADLTLLPGWSALVLQIWKQLWFGQRILLDPLAGRVRSHPPGWVTAATSRTFTSVVKSLESDTLSQEF